jgi:hypothetical protein
MSFLPGRAAACLLAAGALAFAAMSVTALAPGGSLPVAQAEITSPVCSWAGETDQQDINIGAPDSDAFYWLSPLAPSSGTEAVISGEYPQARYFSFHVYNDEGEVLDSIYDQEINPDEAAAERHFTELFALLDRTIGG